MYDLSLIEEYYNKFIKDLYSLIPEGIYTLNLELLHHFDLLHFQPTQERKPLTHPHHFQIVESLEKVTLINDDFIIWIIPDHSDQASITYTLIALNQGDGNLQLEAAFIATGIYNNSTLVLNVLEKFLTEIQDTEQTLHHFKDKLA